MYKKLEIMVNGPFGSVYDVKVDFVNKNAIYKKQDAMFLDLEKFSIDLRNEQLTEFTAKLDEYHVINWDSEYRDPNLAAGYRWQLRLVSNTSEKHSSGIVAVPEEWDKLCKQLTILLGKKFG
ncbi:MAG: hypothetical protein Q3988_00130 [Gemella sp.]|nr:hypothetical protein [Gemella sp.]